MSTFSHLSARYGKMAVFTNDTGALTQSFMKYGEWAELEIQFMLNFVKEGDTVVDVGSYIGSHTLAFASKVGPTGKVFSIEAQPSSYRLLEANIRTNKLSNVKAINAVAGMGDGNLRIKSIDPLMSRSFGSTEIETSIDELEKRNSVDVQQITIDGLNIDECSLLKIDVEGMEHFVINGSSSTLGKSKPIVFAECNSVESGLMTIEVLRRNNYDVHLYISSAYNENNFFGERDNCFGAAKEAAVVGVPPAKRELVSSVALGSGELLLSIENADDLVLGLLNKPQYVGEILSPSAAARDGGHAWIDEMAKLRAASSRDSEHRALEEAALEREREAQRSELLRLEKEREEQRSELLRLEKECEAQRSELLLLKKDIQLAELEKGRLAMAAQVAEQSAVSSGLRVDAAILQASLARKEGERQTALAAAAIAEQMALVKDLEADHQHRIGDLQRELAELGSQLAELRSRCEAAENDRTRVSILADSLLRSTSWRVTRPLRGLGRLLGKR